MPSRRAADFNACALHSDMLQTGWLHTSNAQVNRLIENERWGSGPTILIFPWTTRSAAKGWAGRRTHRCLLPRRATSRMPAPCLENTAGICTWNKSTTAARCRMCCQASARKAAAPPGAMPPRLYRGRCICFLAMKAYCTGSPRHEGLGGGWTGFTGRMSSQARAAYRRPVFTSGTGWGWTTRRTTALREARTIVILPARSIITQ